LSHPPRTLPLAPPVPAAVTRRAAQLRAPPSKPEPAPSSSNSAHPGRSPLQQTTHPPRTRTCSLTYQHRPATNLRHLLRPRGMSVVSAFKPSPFGSGGPDLGRPPMGLSTPTLAMTNTPTAISTTPIVQTREPSPVVAKGRMEVLGPKKAGEVGAFLGVVIVKPTASKPKPPTTRSKPNSAWTSEYTGRSSTLVSWSDKAG
jgi:hypothetical protein